MVAQDQIKLRVEGFDYWGWTAVNVQAGIERAARSFSLAARIKEPLSGTFAEVCPGLRCEVLVWSEEEQTEIKVLDGWIEDLDIGGTAENLSVRLQGRSKTCDAIDSHVLPGWGSVRGKPLVSVVQSLVEPWGIKVFGIDAQDTVKKFAPRSGETVLQAIETLADEHGVLIYDDGDGDLFVVRGGSWDVSLGTLYRGEAGSNIVSGDVRYSTRDRFTYYVCRGQVAGSDNVFGEAAAHPQAEVEDSEDVVGRYRVLVIDAEKGADAERCARRAEFEASQREGKSITGDYLVRGWRDPAGEVWRPGTEIPVEDALTGLYRVMLVEEVAFSLGAEQKPQTKLSIIDPRAWEVLEPIKRDKRKRRRKTFTGEFGKGFVKGGTDKKALSAKAEKGLWLELDGVGNPSPSPNVTQAVTAYSTGEVPGA